MYITFVLNGVNYFELIPLYLDILHESVEETKDGSQFKFIKPQYKIDIQKIQEDRKKFNALCYFANQYS